MHFFAASPYRSASGCSQGCVELPGRAVAGAGSSMAAALEPGFLDPRS